MAALAFGVVVRLWMLAHAGLNSDEAIIGLMADAILRGHFSAFYWGQPYGGGEPYVVAVMFAVFGHSPYVLNITASLLALIATVLTWWLGRRVWGTHGPALVAAACVWIWPEAVLWNSTREFGFRGITLICGLLLLIWAYSLSRRPSTWPICLGLGLALGVGWWSSPEILYFAIPALSLLLWAAARRTLHLAAAHAAIVVLSAVIGATPWIVANVHTHLGSLHAQSQGLLPSTYLGRLHIFFAKVLPMSMGLRIEGAGAWELGKTATFAISLGLVLVFVIGVVGVWTKGPNDARFLVGYLALFPFLYAVFPQTSFWNDGRYTGFLPPVLALVVVEGWASLLAGQGSRRNSARTVLLAVAAVVIVASTSASTLSAFDRTFPRKGQPTTLEPVGNRVVDLVVDALRAHDLDAVVGNYWTAYDVYFVSDRSIATATIQTVRLPALNRQVMNERGATWLFVGPTAADGIAAAAQFGVFSPDPVAMTAAQFRSALTGHGVRYTVATIGPMEAITPQGITGGQLLRRLGLPPPQLAA
ncbi:MAG: glycosyltransferase family 39 protein [Acidimicrobiales bacterium]